MSAPREERAALAAKCEERAAAWLRNFERDTLITVGDLATALRDLAADLRESSREDFRP